MKIECSGTIVVVHTKQQHYLYKRKGFYVGERYVKPKTIRKVKTVALKEPYLAGHIELKVDADFVLNGVYVDEYGNQYVCIKKESIQDAHSVLQIIFPNLGKKFSVPKMLTLIASQYSG